MEDFRTRQINDIPQDWTKMEDGDIKKNWGRIVGNAIGIKN